MSPRLAGGAALALIVAIPFAIEGRHRWAERSVLADRALMCVGSWTDPEHVRRSVDTRSVAVASLYFCERRIAAWCAAAPDPAVVETACRVLPLVARFTHGLTDPR